MQIEIAKKVLRSSAIQRDHQFITLMIDRCVMRLCENRVGSLGIFGYIFRDMPGIWKYKENIEGKFKNLQLSCEFLDTFINITYV